MNIDDLDCRTGRFYLQVGLRALTNFNYMMLLQNMVVWIALQEYFHFFIQNTKYKHIIGVVMKPPESEVQLRLNRHVKDSDMLLVPPKRRCLFQFHLSVIGLLIAALSD